MEYYLWDRILNTFSLENQKSSAFCDPMVALLRNSTKKAFNFTSCYYSIFFILAGVFSFLSRSQFMHISFSITFLARFSYQWLEIHKFFHRFPTCFRSIFLRQRIWLSTNIHCRGLVQEQVFQITVIYLPPINVWWKMHSLLYKCAQ